MPILNTPPHFIPNVATTPIIKYGKINYDGMNDYHDIVDITGMGKIKELCLAVPSNGGMLMFIIDGGIPTTFTNSRTSTVYIYYSSQFPCNLNTSTANKIAWYKLNGSGDIDMAELSAPATIPLDIGLLSDIPSSNSIIIGDLSFNQSMLIQIKSGSVASDDRPYGVIGEYVAS